MNETMKQMDELAQNAADAVAKLKAFVESRYDVDVDEDGDPYEKPFRGAEHLIRASDILLSAIETGLLVCPNEEETR